jgi:hypothetical protein
MALPKQVEAQLKELEKIEQQIADSQKQATPPTDLVPLQQSQHLLNQRQHRQNLS